MARPREGDLTMVTRPDYAKMSAEQARRVRSGGRSLAASVRGTARQKTLRLMKDEAARVAVEEFGDRRQKRALQRAVAKIEKLSRLPRQPTVRMSGLVCVVVDDPYESKAKASERQVVVDRRDSRVGPVA